MIGKLVFPRFSGHPGGAVWEKETMNTPIPKAKCRHDKEFKLAAINHWLTSGKTRKEAAADLGISAWNLRDWKRAQDRLGQDAPRARTRTAAELEAENLRLRQENQSLRNQRDILKKSLGILSEPMMNGSTI
jgi:transposase